MENTKFKNQMVNAFERALATNQTIQFETEWKHEDLMVLKVKAEKFNETEYGLKNDISSVINYITGVCFAMGEFKNEKGQFVDFVPDLSWVFANEDDKYVYIEIDIEVRVK